MKEKLIRLFEVAITRYQKTGASLFLTGLLQNSRGISVFNRELNSLEIADESRIGILAGREGRWGSALIERLDEASLIKAIDQALQTSSFNDPNPDFTLAPPQKTDLQFKQDKTIDDLSIKQLEEWGLQMEEKSYAFSSSITNVPHVSVGRQTQTRVFLNSEGAQLVEESRFLRASLSVMAQGNDGRIVNASEGFSFNRGNDFNPIKAVDEVCTEAVSRLNPKVVPSGMYPVLFDPRMAAQLLGTFADIFSGELLYKKLTRLEGKLGQAIASHGVSIVDDPHLGLSPHIYDAEATISFKKKIINEGIFETFLHNRHTASKTGMTSTGNAEGGFGNLPGVAPTNIFWDGKSTPVPEIMAGLQKAILVKELHGASSSPISGDFSYGALGYLIEDGKVTGPIADFTVAGNFLELLKNITAIGDDLRFLSPSLLGSVGGRSLLVSQLSVSGK